MPAKKTGLLSPMAYVRQRSIYQGLLGGRRGWLAVGGVVWGARLLRKLVGRNEEFVTLERLKPGQTVVIRALERPTRRRR